MSDADAWLLDLGHGLHAAVGELEITYLLPDPPKLFAIPHSPVYVPQVLIWQDEIVPLMNLAMRLALAPEPNPRMLAAILAYQDKPGAVQRHGALWLATPPVRIQVSDALACDLPEPQSNWRRLAFACFEYAHIGPVPVLNLHRVFSLPLGDINESSEK